MGQFDIVAASYEIVGDDVIKKETVGDKPTAAKLIALEIDDLNSRKAFVQDRISILQDQETAIQSKIDELETFLLTLK